MCCACTRYPAGPAADGVSPHPPQQTFFTSIGPARSDLGANPAQWPLCSTCEAVAVEAAGKVSDLEVDSLVATLHRARGRRGGRDRGGGAASSDRLRRASQHTSQLEKAKNVHAARLHCVAEQLAMPCPRFAALLRTVLRSSAWGGGLHETTTGADSVLWLDTLLSEQGALFTAAQARQLLATCLERHAAPSARRGVTVARSQHQGHTHNHTHLRTRDHCYRPGRPHRRASIERTHAAETLGLVGAIGPRVVDKWNLLGLTGFGMGESRRLHADEWGYWAQEQRIAFTVEPVTGPFALRGIGRITRTVVDGTVYQVFSVAGGGATVWYRVQEVSCVDMARAMLAQLRCCFVDYPLGALTQAQMHLTLERLRGNASARTRKQLSTSWRRESAERYPFGASARRAGAGTSGAPAMAAAAATGSRAQRLPRLRLRLCRMPASDSASTSTETTTSDAASTASTASQDSAHVSVRSVRRGTDAREGKHEDDDDGVFSGPNRECPVCLDRTIDTALQCGHQYCAACADALATCALCRTPVEMRVHLI